MHADCLPGARVTVCVNNEELTEHSTENDALSATTFIEAIAGANFAVVLQLDDAFAYHNPLDRVELVVYLDGERAASMIADPNNRAHAKTVIDCAYETLGNKSTRRKFLFAELETSDGQTSASLSKKLASIGEIKAELVRCRSEGKHFKCDDRINFKGIGDADVTEKSLKGRSVSNHAKLGPSEGVQLREYANVSYPYGGRTPLATYLFQYRSRRDLEIEGIVERPPSPVPLIERDPDELTADELREQNRLFRAAREAAANVKQEIKREKRPRQRSATLSGDEGDVTVLSESNKRKRTRQSMEGADVVDLT